MSHMRGIKSGGSLAQPGRVLTDAEWEALHHAVQTNLSVSVEKLCRLAGVSRARYYRRYPVGDHGPRSAKGESS